MDYDIYNRKHRREIQMVDKKAMRVELPVIKKNSGLIDKIKNFYSDENEWKCWSNRDKLYWTITLLILGVAIAIFTL